MTPGGSSLCGVGGCWGSEAAGGATIPIFDVLYAFQGQSRPVHADRDPLGCAFSLESVL